jgi:steroid delta-isomerase-like uncharacterized protein
VSAAPAGGEAIIRQFYDRAWNSDDLTAYDELVTDDFVDHQAMPGLPSGREGFRQLQVVFRTAFPDVRVEVEDVVAEGELVAARWISTGTHQGPLFGIPPTGRPVRVTAMVVYRVEGGRLAEGWINRDDLGMMRQLGVVPTPG